MVISQANLQSACGWTQVGTLSSDVVKLDKTLKVDQQAPAKFLERLLQMVQRQSKRFGHTRRKRGPAADHMRFENLTARVAKLGMHARTHALHGLLNSV